VVAEKKSARWADDLVSPASGSKQRSKKGAPPPKHSSFATSSVLKKSSLIKETESSGVGVSGVDDVGVKTKAAKEEVVDKKVAVQEQKMEKDVVKLVEKESEEKPLKDGSLDNDEEEDSDDDDDDDDSEDDDSEEEVTLEELFDALDDDHDGVLDLAEVSSRVGIVFNDDDDAFVFI
jgi:hypothetical protein